METANATNSETTDPKEGQSVESASDSTGQSDTQVDKFNGKSDEDIKKAYFELEKEKGRLANEKYQAEQKALAYEQALHASQSQKVVHETKVETPDEIYLREVKVDPERAILNLNNNKLKQEKLSQQAQATAQTYWQLKTGKVPDFEDFPELEQEMAQIAQVYAPMLNPDNVNSPQTLEALIYMARGRKVQQLAEKAKNEGASQAGKKDFAKEKAFMESSGSSNIESNDDFAGLPLAEMEKRTPFKKYIS
jgi:hypothetical protein